MKAYGNWGEEYKAKGKGNPDSIEATVFVRIDWQSAGFELEK